MYPNYPCRNAQSCCNEMANMDNCCNLGRRNQSMIDCCPPRRRLQDFRVFESRPRAPKCKGLAHTLTEAKQQAKMMAAAAAIAQYQNLNTNTRNAYASKSSSKFSSQHQMACKQSPYQKAHNSPSPSSYHCSNSSSNQCSLKSQDSNQSSSLTACNTAQCSGKKSTRQRSKDKDLKVKKNQSSYSVSMTNSGCTSKTCPTTGLHQKLNQHQSQNLNQNQKYLKNKQNYQYQDDFGGKKRRMEVISEEQEEMMGSEDEDFNSYSFDSEQGRKIQESCADFLNIVNDSVLDTVQKSVETILKEYFMHTLEKIECLCAQMVRNDCLMSKMYLDIMDKISQNNEKNQRQFKCLCQFLIDTRKPSEEPQSKQTSGSSSELDCAKTCPEKHKYRCECGCKREGGSNFAKDGKNKSGSNHSSQTEEEKNTPHEPPKLRKTCNAAECTDKNLGNKLPNYEEEFRNCCGAASATNGEESRNKLSNNTSWNSSGLSTSNSNTTYNSEIPRNGGLVDTVITEEIRYFRNQSRIVPNGVDNVKRSPLQPEMPQMPRGNCCGAANKADTQTKTNETESRTFSGRAADGSSKNLATDYCTETHSKATRSEKRRRNNDLSFPNTRPHIKKKKSSR